MIIVFSIHKLSYILYRHIYIIRMPMCTHGFCVIQNIHHKYVLTCV